MASKRIIAGIGGVAAVLLAIIWIISSGNAPETESGGAATTTVDVVRVVTSTVMEAEFPDELEALGTTSANESIEVTSKLSEVVTAIHFEEGQKVIAGDKLVEMRNSEALADHAEARAALVDSQGQFNRSRELLATRAVSESEVERLEAQLDADKARVLAAEARLADTMIKAPFAGRVGLRRISPGSLLTPGTVVTTLDDTSTMKLDFSVPEIFMAALRVGLEVSARSVAYPDKIFAGAVSGIDTRVDPVTRSVRVRALLPNEKELLKPGMFLTVRVIRNRQTVLVIPEQCIVPEQDRKYVFVIENDTAEKRQVTTGRRREGEVEILAGLASGEIVVVEGTQKLDEGTPVKARRMESGSEAGP